MLVVACGLLCTPGAAVYGLKHPGPWPGWFGFHEVFPALSIAGFAAHYVAVFPATAMLAEICEKRARKFKVPVAAERVFGVLGGECFSCREQVAFRNRVFAVRACYCLSWLQLWFPELQASAWVFSARGSFIIFPVSPVGASSRRYGTRASRVPEYLHPKEMWHGVRHCEVVQRGQGFRLHRAGRRRY
ncbi:hypothetical protein ACQ9ZG_30220 [Streptomyces araujoniae]|uniref:hypothetical protein n=1 Tax=Streptomyces sp. ZEA17I TaxID=2202516 RepID=UPI0035C071D9